MAPPELKELRKKSKESSRPVYLIDLGRPSTSPRGTSGKATTKCASQKDEPKTANTLEEHVENLRNVFQVLRENQLYVKREKCEFTQPEAKIKEIQEWKALTKVTELRLFLGLVNYYRRFISGYSAKVAPFTELLKKNNLWVWNEEWQKAFKGLKAALTKEPILTLPDFSKTFKIHTDASEFAIG
uniref:Reverse transcriptase/retrotransposon-derived protein RNase H-like domain-containing protein n=1 Tax=Solanum lycopersicum TaxID=4081 RepID=A0A3Q7FNS9_SOLLC